MSTLLVYLAMIAAVNPLRLRAALPGGETRAAPWPLIGGSTLTLAAGGVLALWADSLLDALDVTPETFRIAAGMVAALVGFRVLVAPGRAREPELGGRASAVVPVAFPLLITPQLALMTTSFAASESVGEAIGSLAASLLLTVGLGMVVHRRAGLWLAGARLLAGILILAGVALIVEGIRDV